MRSLPDLSLWLRTLRVALGLLVIITQSTWAMEVRVYTDGSHPVSVPRSVRLICLDEPARLQRELSEGLPTDPAEATRAVSERLHAEGSEFGHRLSFAYQDMVEAWNLGILKLPAVVVDGRYVVYGDTDVAHALSLIERYREGTH